MARGIEAGSSGTQLEGCTSINTVRNEGRDIFRKVPLNSPDSPPETSKILRGIETSNHRLTSRLECDVSLPRGAGRRIGRKNYEGARCPEEDCRTVFLIECAILGRMEKEWT